MNKFELSTNVWITLISKYRRKIKVHVRHILEMRFQ